MKQATGDRTGEGEALNYLGYAYGAARQLCPGRRAASPGRHHLARRSGAALQPLSLALVDLSETHLSCGEHDAALAAAAWPQPEIAADHRLSPAAGTRDAGPKPRAQDGRAHRRDAIALAQQALDLYATLDPAKAGLIQAQLAAWQRG